VSPVEHPPTTAAPLRPRRRLPERRGPGERLEAWLFTGPLGHLYGFVADVAALWVRYARGRPLS
jgi:hypothetical protein